MDEGIAWWKPRLLEHDSRIALKDVVWFRGRMCGAVMDLIDESLIMLER